MTANTIYPTESIRYTDRARWGWNNGFRRRWLANARATAALVAKAKSGDLDAALTVAAEKGGLTQKRGFARSLIRAAQKAGPLPPYRLNHEGGHTIVECLSVTWKFRGRRQIAAIEYLPMWGA